MIHDLQYATKEFLNGKDIVLPPFLLNPFLRTVENMELPVRVELKFQKHETVFTNPKNPAYEPVKVTCYYEIRHTKTR